MEMLSPNENTIHETQKKLFVYLNVFLTPLSYAITLLITKFIALIKTNTIFFLLPPSAINRIFATYNLRNTRLIAKHFF